MVDPSVCYENSSVRSFTMGESLLIAVIPLQLFKVKGSVKGQIFSLKFEENVLEDKKNIFLHHFR